MKVQAMPISKSGLLHKEVLMRNIASVATALEVLESILVKKGVLEDGQLMREVQAFVNQGFAQDKHLDGDDD